MLSAGARVGGYEIVAVLGTGAMGEVYRARDPILARDVALKVLRPAWTNAPDALARFHREARALASLNHPNIAQIFGVEEAQNVVAVLMELVEGPTLAERLAHGPLTVDESLAIGGQIADALQYAHDRGLIHRDLKPANIKVRPDGVVKVLDFGLAKTTAGADTAADDRLTVAAETLPGVVVGTLAYMAPEQARGHPVDRRADMWAFACVLFELLSGRHPFAAGSSSEILARALEREPDWTELPATTPATVRTLLRRCLVKDPKQRFDSAAAARIEIDEAWGLAEATTPPARGSPRQRSVVLVWLTAGVLAGLVAFMASGRIRTTPAASGTVARFTLDLSPKLALVPQGSDRDLAFARDGSTLVYRGGTDAQLVVRHLDRSEAAPLAGTAAARSPFLSPDGRWIGFVENNTTLRKVPVAGGPAVTLATLPGSARGAAWVDETTIVVATSAGGLVSVAAGGGTPIPLTAPDLGAGELAHLHPAALPGRGLVLFTIERARPQPPQVGLLDLGTRRHTILLADGRDAQYVNSGHLVYTKDNSLLAIRVDPSGPVVLGAPVPVAEGVWMSSTGAANAAVSDSGTLVYVPRSTERVPARTVVWVDRAGRERPIPIPPGPYEVARLSPDGSVIAVQARDPQDSLWVWNTRRLSWTQLTFGGGMAPVFAIDGRRLVFTRPTAGGGPSLHVQSVDGSGTETPLTRNTTVQVPTSMAPGGAIVSDERRAQTGSDVVRFAFSDTGQPATSEPIVATPFAERNGVVSPDGRYLAYESNEAGTFDVYVVPYPGGPRAGRWRVSTGGGTRPSWTRGGRELIYVDPTNHLTAVQVDNSELVFHSGMRETLRVMVYTNAAIAWRSYDVSSDGQSFLVIKDAASGNQTNSASNLAVIVNWVEELKQRVP